MGEKEKMVLIWRLMRSIGFWILWETWVAMEWECLGEKGWGGGTRLTKVLTRVDRGSSKADWGDGCLAGGWPRVRGISCHDIINRRHMCRCIGTVSGNRRSLSLLDRSRRRHGPKRMGTNIQVIKETLTIINIKEVMAGERYEVMEPKGKTVSSKVTWWEIIICFV